MITWGSQSFDSTATRAENFNPWQSNGATAFMVPEVAVQSTTGGIGRWTIQIPRQPTKREIVFRRNMENADRADLHDIADLLEALTKPGSK